MEVRPDKLEVEIEIVLRAPSISATAAAASPSPPDHVPDRTASRRSQACRCPAGASSRRSAIWYRRQGRRCLTLDAIPVRANTDRAGISRSEHNSEPHRNSLRLQNQCSTIAKSCIAISPATINTHAQSGIRCITALMPLQFIVEGRAAAPMSRPSAFLAINDGKHL